MGKSLSDIEGIASAYEKKLNSGGIRSISRLLNEGSTPTGREQIAQKCDLSKKLVMKWVNHADLFRVKGVAGQYAELLECSGVDTVVELSNRNAENLHNTMVSTNQSKRLCQRPPGLKTVENWVNQAKQLPRVVNY